MKIKKVDYLGLDHDKIRSTYGKNLKFVNYMNVTTLDGKGEMVAAVYHDSNPDTSKNHKEFMLIHRVTDPVLFTSKYYVTGRTIKEIKKDRITSGIHCQECDTVMYSIHRHDFHGCSCDNEARVDGGRDYLRYLAKDLNKIKVVTIDLLTDEVE